MSDDLTKRLQDRAETKLVAYDRSGHKLLFAVYEDDYVKEEPADKDCAEALARIEQLEIQVRFLDDLNSVAVTAKEQAEAMLAKAVEALREIETDCDADYPPSHGAIKYAIRTALAEMEGETK